MDDHFSMDTATTIYDSIVIGAGIEGSATAYQLSRTGQTSVLLEQFALPHTNGSSHGGSRIIRRAYKEDCFAAMTSEAFKEWAHMEQISGTKLYLQTGLLYFGQKSSTEVENVVHHLKTYDAPHSILDHSGLSKRYPMFQFPPDSYGVLDDLGGILLADKALTCLQDLYKKQGGYIVDSCKVNHIQPGSVVTLGTTRGSFKARSLVICAGTWAGQLVEQIGLHLPIQPQRSFVLYWKEQDPGSHSPSSGMPCFIDCHDGVYGLPSHEYPGYAKICCHGGYDFHITNPEEHENKPPYNLQFACDYVRQRLPGLESSSPAIIQKCKYAQTPDDICILDTHPHHSNIAIAAGFCGTGFKLAPVIGNIMRDLITGKTPTYDLSPFAINRWDS